MRPRGWCRRGRAVRSSGAAARWRRCRWTRSPTCWWPRARAPRSTASRSRSAARCWGRVATRRRCCGSTPRAAPWSRRRRSRRRCRRGRLLFADGAAVKRAFAPVWQPLDAGWLASHAATRDDQEGEGDYLGLGTVFPHTATSVKAMRATPGGDRLLLELALRRGHARRRDRGRAAGAAGAVAVVERLRRSRVRSRQLGGLGRAAPARSRARRAARGAGRAGWCQRLRRHAHRRSRQLSAARDVAHRTGALVPARGRRPLAAAVRPRGAHHRGRHRAPAGRGADDRRRRGRSVRLPDARRARRCRPPSARRCTSGSMRCSSGAARSRR